MRGPLFRMKPCLRSLGSFFAAMAGILFGFFLARAARILEKA